MLVENKGGGRANACQEWGEAMGEILDVRLFSFMVGIEMENNHDRTFPDRRRPCFSQTKMVA